MKIIKCPEPNDNIFFVSKLFNDLKLCKKGYKWVVSDLDLVPVEQGDYSGIGGKAKNSTAYDFMKKMERDKVAVINLDELYDIFEDTQTIRNGVFICLNDKDEINMDTYRPRVEGKNTNQIYDERAKCEIRILDGDLIYILQ